MTNSYSGQASRFVIAGGLNTLVTGVALSLLATIIDYQLAYAIVFAGGVAMSLWLAGAFVFGGDVTFGRSVTYVLLYIGVFLVVWLVLRWMNASGLPAWTSGLIVLVTAPLSFMGGRAIFSSPRNVESEVDE